MRGKFLTAISVLAASCAFMAQGGVGFRKMSASEAERYASAYGGPRSRVSMWIWSDKYVYQPNETLTLRWTVKPNNDLYPYTVVAYRQNNQTGAKYYLPGGGEEVTDIYGNTLSQGFQPMQLQAAEKAVVIGTGGLFPAATIPNEPGMHTLAVELRDYTGTRVLKTAYMKIGVVTRKETIQGEITSDRTLTNDTEWDLKGIVFVKNNATLTIEPGTFIIGQPGSQPPSALVVTRNGRIQAAGTASRPIVMTSSQPFGQRKRGDWGGLLLLGKAPINVGANAGGANNPAGSFYIEGLNATEDGLYGGSDPTHNCGTLQYVRVEYAGSILSPNNETNSFTFGGCGTRTVADHLQAIYGLDDSFEWFGGTMDAKYLVGGLGADDYLDYQLGYTGRIQFGLFYQSPDARGNRGIEGDNSEYNQGAEPYSNPTVFNATFIGSGQPGYDESNAPGIYVRRGSRGSFNNLVVTNFYSGAMDIADANTQAQADAGKLTMNGILIWNNNIGGQGANTLAGQIPAAYAQAYAQGQKGANGRPAGKNFVVADPMLTRPFEYSDPDFSGMFGSPLFRAGFVAPPDDGFFDQTARFIGGIGDVNWTEGWTSFLVETDIAP
jgi:hypothetical protein